MERRIQPAPQAAQRRGALRRWQQGQGVRAAV